WSGDDSVFTIVDVGGNFQVRSNKLLTNSSYCLSTPSALVNDAQWEFSVRLLFNTSSANYVDVYLCSDQANLLSAGVNGYFVRIGGTTDEVSFYKTVNGIKTKIIDGTDGTTNHTSNDLKVKVKCSAAGEWTLEQKKQTATTYAQEGTTTDLSITSSAHFGIAISQSTSSFFQKHFFDDIYVGPILYDLTPPILISANAVSFSELDVLFSEPLDSNSASSVVNYSLASGPSISAALLDSLNPALVHLTFSGNVINGTTCTLITQNVADLALNVSLQQTVNFQALFSETPNIGDLLINEFLCDESPSIGLPEVEYVEVFNASQKIFDMHGWKIGDATGYGTLQNGWIYPGEYKVLCATANASYFNNASMVSSFPSLNNAGDQLILRDADGHQLDSLAYTTDWYQDPLKSNGGYAIERINPFDPCSAQDNWKASASVIGGTPEIQNSVYSDLPDLLPPKLLELVPLAPNVLQVFFNEGMDSTQLAAAIIETVPPLNIYKRAIYGAHPSMMTLIFSDNLVGGQVYAIQMQQLSDCWMNQTDIQANFVLPQTPALGDLVINELLVDPLTGGSDWIEVYNSSEKWIDLMDWRLANFDNGVVDNFQSVTQHFYLAPHEYAVLGSDSSFVKQHYPFAVSGRFVQLETPAYAVDSGTVLLYYFDQLMDTVSYSNEWHFALLESSDGVSLERVRTEGPSNQREYWHSAAEAIGFASPGMKNSQDMQGNLAGDFALSSNIVSPDNDGKDDVLEFTYTMLEPGMLGTLVLYDDEGRVVKKIFSNELLGISGSVTWDGITEEQYKASIGTYIAVFSAFALNGQSAVNKRKAFVVAGRL
ncbi:MAG: hypothetical protein RL362_1352, partial [Bacteroidota bacterium]